MISAPPSFGTDIGDQNICVGELACLAIAQAETFLVVLDGGDDDFRRHVEKALSKPPINTTGHSTSPATSLSRPSSSINFEPLREGEVLGFRADRFGPRRGIDKHMWPCQACVHKFQNAAHQSHPVTGSDGPCVVLPACNAVHIKRHHLAIKAAQDRMQGTHPAQAA